MQRKINILCAVLGLLTWSGTACIIHSELKDIRITVFGLILTYVFSLLFILLQYTSFIKTNMFSDIKEDYKSPVYKLERGTVGVMCVRKYIVSYSTIDSGWALLFTPIFLFKFKQYVGGEYYILTQGIYESILDGLLSPEKFYKQKSYSDINYKELAKIKLEAKIREINKEYYDNFK